MPYSDQVDAEPARAHVQRLLDGGMSIVQIQNLSGVNRTCIRVLTGDYPARKRSVQIRADTARRLLRTRLDRGSSIDGLVPSIGTVRRVHALQAIGWTGRDLAARLGATTGRPAVQVGRRGLVRADSAMRVEELYLELADTPGPSSRSREYARLQGWLPPIWWDDDQMDDPLYAPDGIRSFRQAGRVLVDDAALPRPERIALLTKRGFTDVEIAERIGTSVRYVKRDRVERPRAARVSISDAGVCPTDTELDEVIVRRLVDGVLQLPAGAKSPERVEAVRRLANAGLADTAISQRVGLSRDAVLKVRSRNGIAAGAPIGRTA